MTMDKEKVIELIGNVEKYLLAYEKSGKNADIAMAFQQLHEAEDELSKSDWISVEEELPPYGESVWVYSKDIECYGSATRLNIGDYHYDDNGFLKSLHVTHWRKIDKEV